MDSKRTNGKDKLFLHRELAGGDGRILSVGMPTCSGAELLIAQRAQLLIDRVMSDGENSTMPLFPPSPLFRPIPPCF